METVVDSFLRLVESFRKAPLSFLIVLLVVIAIYFSYTQIEYIKTLLPNPEKENAQFQLTLQRDLTINSALQDSQEYLGARVIVISQFHNGQYDLTRLPFTKTSVTYASGDTGLNSNDLYGPRPLSTMNHLMLDMWKDKNNPQCVAMSVKEIEDTAYKLRMEGSGNKFMSLCPITNLLNYPIGYIGIGYDFQPKPEEIPKLLAYEKLMTARIAGYLQDGVVKNDRN